GVISRAARQFLAQGRELLVAGECATRRLLLSALRAVAGVAALGSTLSGGGSGVGLLGLRDLAHVLLVASVRLGVLPLPLLTLLLVAFLPLLRVGVEALGVDVVAVLVVLGRHAVLRGVELGVRAVPLVGLLERQRDAATLEVDVDDLDHDLGADLHDLLGDLDVALGQLRDVHQALDALLDADERAERDELGDLARHDLPDRVGAGVGPPRVLLGGLERQRDALAVHLHREDLDGDLLADLDDLARVVDVLPGQLGHVDEAVHAAEVDERTEVDHRGDHALADLAGLELVEELAADLGLGLLQPGAPRQDHVVAVLVQLDDLGLELAADVRLQVADPAHLDQGGGQEAAQADVQDQAALDDLDHGALDRLVGLLEGLDGAPGALVLGALLREDQPTFLVLLLEDEGLDALTDRHHLGGVDVVLDRELPRGDDALGLVADVEQDLVPVDLHDGALDDVAIVEVLDRLVDGGEEVLLRPDVVDGDLRRGRGGGGVD